MIQTSSKLLQNFFKLVSKFYLLFFIFNSINIHGEKENLISRSILAAKLKMVQTYEGLTPFYSKFSTIIQLLGFSVIGLVTHLIYKRYELNRELDEIKRKSIHNINSAIAKIDEFEKSGAISVDVINNLFEIKSLILIGSRSMSENVLAKMAKEIIDNKGKIYWLNPYMFTQYNAADIFKFFFDAIQKESIKNHKPSYIFIERLELSPIYKNSTLFSLFFDYINDLEYKKNVHIVATTSEEKINPDLYSPNALKKIAFGSEKSKEALVLEEQVQELFYLFKKDAYGVTLNNTQNELFKTLEKENNSVLFMGLPFSGKTTIMTKIAENAANKGSKIYCIIPGGMDFENFTAIFNDAKEKAEANKVPSYILIKNLESSSIYSNDVLFSAFLRYASNTTYKKHVRIFATTTDSGINSSVYSPNRLELKIVGDSKDFKNAVNQSNRMKNIQKAFPPKKEATDDDEEELV